MQKNKTEVPIPTAPVVVVPKVKSITLGGDLVTYTYDNKGRLLSEIPL